MEAVIYTFLNASHQVALKWTWTKKSEDFLSYRGHLEKVILPKQCPKNLPFFKNSNWIPIEK